MPDKRPENNPENPTNAPEIGKLELEGVENKIEEVGQDTIDEALAGKIDGATAKGRVDALKVEVQKLRERLSESETEGQKVIRGLQAKISRLESLATSAAEVHRQGKKQGSFVDRALDVANVFDLSGGDSEAGEK